MSLLDGLPNSVKLRPPARATDLATFREKFGDRFPADYLEFMKECNGLEGAVSDLNYLQLWDLETVVRMNNAYGFSEETSGVIVIASNGSDTAFGFDFRSDELQVRAIPFGGYGIENSIVCGATFTEFLSRLFANEEFIV